MPVWIIAAALGSIVVTGVLTFVLWRLNTPMLERNKNGDGGDGGGGATAGWADGSHDGGSDGGGGDGGGGE